MPTYPNMGLILPEVSVTLGPIWAQMLNTSSSVVDAHDHSPGKGVKIKPSGLNINSDLTFQGNNATNVNSTEFVTTLTGTLTSVASIYSYNGDLYWNNGGGTPIQITSGVSVNSSSDGIARRFETVQISSNTVISAVDTYSYLEVDTTSSIQITLPAANSVNAGRFYEIKDVVGLAATNNIIILPNGSDTIDGVASYTIDENLDHIRLVSDGSSIWHTNAIVLASSARRSVQTVFTSSGTWTKSTNNPLWVRVTCIGGGGAGGGMNTDVSSGSEGCEGGGGGGGGCSIKTILSASLGVTETVTVGAGATYGGSSGSSSFGSHCTANGGDNGEDGTVTTGFSTANGGSGGAASGGDINFTGGDGGMGRVMSGEPVKGCFGGASHFSGIRRASASLGTVGRNYGGGASGVTVGSPQAQTGGQSGASGIVIVEEFFE